MELDFLDVMAGNMLAALWIVWILHSRRTYLAEPRPLTGFLLFIPVAFGMLFVISRLAYWAHEKQNAIAAMLQG